MLKSIDYRVHLVKEESNSYSVVAHIHSWFNAEEQDFFLDKLNGIDNWNERNARDAPKNRKSKRKLLWFNEDGNYFCSDWKHKPKHWNSNKYMGWLSLLQTRVLKEMSVFLDSTNISSLEGVNSSLLNFNSVLINKYSKSSDIIGPHRDQEYIFGDNPSIISLSFGSTRIFRLTRVKHNSRKPKEIRTDKQNSHLNIDFELQSGDILMMLGETQKHYVHEILEGQEGDKERYNLTFRRHLA